MPDITMCEGGLCPLKEKCYRFTATSSGELQSYFVHPPYLFQTNHCDYFWEEKDD